MSTPTINAHPCPPWCTIPEGHDFTPLLSGGLTRDHEGPLLGDQVRIQPVVTDYALTTDGPVITGPVLVALDTDNHRPHPLTAEVLRRIAADFHTAAGLLDGPRR